MPANDTATGARYQPLASGGRDSAAPVTVGGVLSILIAVPRPSRADAVGCAAYLVVDALRVIDQRRDRRSRSSGSVASTTVQSMTTSSDTSVGASIARSRAGRRVHRGRAAGGCAAAGRRARAMRRSSPQGLGRTNAARSACPQVSLHPRDLREQEAAGGGDGEQGQCATEEQLVVVRRARDRRLVLARGLRRRRGRWSRRSSPWWRPGPGRARGLRWRLGGGGRLPRGASSRRRRLGGGRLPPGAGPPRRRLLGGVPLGGLGRWPRCCPMKRAAGEDSVLGGAVGAGWTGADWLGAGLLGAGAGLLGAGAGLLGAGLLGAGLLGAGAGWLPPGAGSGFGGPGAGSGCCARAGAAEERRATGEPQGLRSSSLSSACFCASSRQSETSSSARRYERRRVRSSSADVNRQMSD